MSPLYPPRTDIVSRTGHVAKVPSRLMRRSKVTSIAFFLGPVCV
jgi:hypothetical protein